MKTEQERPQRHGVNRKVPTPSRETEMKICGARACISLFKHRPQDIIRAYVLEERLGEFSAILKRCAAEKRAYRILSAEELEKVAQSRHHEGICLLVKKPVFHTLQDYLAKRDGQKTDGRSCLVALENVENPHNLGAILRVCAHFGANAVLLASRDPALSGSAYRIAEGGAECLTIVKTDSLQQAVTLLKTKGYAIVATSSHSEKSLFFATISEKTLFLFGSEGQGLTPALLQSADQTVSIPGTAHVESLNVACATSVLLGEYWRRHKTGLR